jgi:Z1 domain
MPEPTAQQDQALRTARVLLDLGHDKDAVINNSAIPEEVRGWVEEQIRNEAAQTFVLARVIAGSQDREEWLAGIDRSDWYYWKTLRSYLLGVKNWPRDTVASLDDASDRVLRQLRPPSTAEFDVRGLVLGYVQSGKTANFTAVIAKAADAGYRLVVVLSGIDKGLRRQTQLRLNRELTGYTHNPPGAVRFPPVGRQWHQFTTDDLDGDFHPGRANSAALQGSQPVLIVAKKNGAVLRRLQSWFMTASEDVRRNLPALFIDDESDQASVDTRGSHQTQDEFDPADPDYEPPAVINRLIRELLQIFSRRAYVAYTATPFANILIPHDAFDGSAGEDLYPKDFFIDLPKPAGYFGTEEFFGRFDPSDDQSIEGLDVLRIVPEEEVKAIVAGPEVTATLEEALHSFVLGGAARAARGKPEAPCTMLVHTSHRIADQGPTKAMVEARFREIRDEWRYDRRGGIRARFERIWNDDFIPTSEGVPGRSVHSFGEIEPFLGPFMDAVSVREINSDRGEVLDYELEPDLKAIAVGGNKLSRGLTLEGLLVSYFARRSPQYDTLLQMCRWYGYRGGYEDLTRIYTTGELAGWFADLALVEHRLRQDMQVYENMPGITPREVGMRILQHPTMQVTSGLKRRFTTSTLISQSYSETLEQTFKFPLRDEERLSLLCERNRLASRGFLERLGGQPRATSFGPMWTDVGASEVVDFLRTFVVDPDVGGTSPELMGAWIELQNVEGELVNWTVAVRGRESENVRLGRATWLPDGLAPVWNLSRTRIIGSNSLGVITTPGDEEFGLDPRELAAARRAAEDGLTKDRNKAARQSRSSRCGLLLLYPISRFSGHDGQPIAKAREPLYIDPEGPYARDLIGLAVSFPKTTKANPAEAYLEGTARWRPVL